jgi:hypothetical protein
MILLERRHASRLPSLRSARRGLDLRLPFPIIWAVVGAPLNHRR